MTTNSLRHNLQRLRGRFILLIFPLVLSGCTLRDWFGEPGRNLPDQLEVKDIAGFITHAIKFLAEFGFLVAFFVMVAGYQYLMSAGSEEGVTRAKDTIKYAAFGMVFLVGGYAIVRLIFALFAPDAAKTIFQ